MQTNALPGGPEPDPGSDDGAPLAPGFVHDYLAYLLAAASHRTSAEFHAVVRENGLRVPEWRVLACLASRDEVIVSELARMTLYEQPRLTKILNQMERDGLVTRNDDPDDRRRVVIRTTSKGRESIAPLIDAAARHEEEVLKRFSPRERAALKMLLRLMLER